MSGNRDHLVEPAQRTSSTVSSLSTGRSFSEAGVTHNDARPEPAIDSSLTMAEPENTECHGTLLGYWEGIRRENTDRPHHEASPSLDGYLNPPNLKVKFAPTTPGIDSQIILHVPVTPESNRDQGESGYLSDPVCYPKSSPVAAQSLRMMPSLHRAKSKKAVLQRKRNTVMNHALARGGTVAPGQPSRARRVRNGRFLQMEWRGAEHRQEGQPTLVRDIQVTAWCLGIGIDLPALHKDLVQKFGDDKVTLFPDPGEYIRSQDRRQARREVSCFEDMSDAERSCMINMRLWEDAIAECSVLHLYYSDPNGHLAGEAIYVEYGSVVTWGIPIDLHSDVVFNFAGSHLIEPKDYGAIQADSLRVQVVQDLFNPTIRDDTLVLHEQLFDQLEVRVGVSLALAQSTRLSMQEELTMRIIEETKLYPFALVDQGKVHVDQADIARLIGNVFLEKTELNLQVLPGPYSYPKFFSACQDHVQKLYELVSNNFDLEDRADMLNKRFSALAEMLNLIRDQQGAAHEEHVSGIVICLILITAVLGLLQMLSTIFGDRIFNNDIFSNIGNFFGDGVYNVV